MRGVHLVERKAGTAIYISYTPPGEKRARELVEMVPSGREFSKRLGEATRRAEKVLTKRKAAIIEGKQEIAPPKSIAFSAFVKRHYQPELEGRELRSLDIEVQRLTTGPLGQFFGSMSLSKLDAWQVRRFVKARREGAIGARGVGPAAINRDLARLSNLWEFAAKKGYVRGKNPVAEAGRLQEPSGRVRFLTPEEEARLVAELPADLRPLVEVALHTGIRRGALFGLRWRDVHLSQSVIVVPDTLSKSRRAYSVRMNRRVAELFAEQRQRVGDSGPDGLVFPKRDGSQRKSVSGAFKTACERAGIEDFRWHDLRHTAASRIVMNGGSLYDAGQHLGHRTLEMTQRYAHLSPEHMAGVAELTTGLLALPQARRSRPVS